MGENLPLSVWGIAARWVSGLPFNNAITALLLLTVLGYVGYDVVYARPAAQSHAQALVENIERHHGTTVQTITAAWQREGELNRQNIDRLLNAIRAEHRLGNPLDPRNLAIRP